MNRLQCHKNKILLPDQWDRWCCTTYQPNHCRKDRWSIYRRDRSSPWFFFKLRNILLSFIISNRECGRFHFVPVVLTGAELQDSQKALAWPCSIYSGSKRKRKAVHKSSNTTSSKHLLFRKLLFVWRRFHSGFWSHARLPKAQTPRKRKYNCFFVYNTMWPVVRELFNPALGAGAL